LTGRIANLGNALRHDDLPSNYFYASDDDDANDGDNSIVDFERPPLALRHNLEVMMHLLIPLRLPTTFSTYFFS